MANFQIPVVTGEESKEDLIQVVAKMQKLLNWVMQGRIDFKNIRANSITADRMDVDQLSAISADIGEITAGILRGIEIYGSYIATREGAYPRAEMNDDEDLFAVYTTATKVMKVTPSLFGTPAVFLDDGATQAAIYPFPFLGNTLQIQSSTDITLQPGSSKNINVPFWSQLYSSGNGQSLQTALNAINSTLSSLQSQINSLDSRVSALESA